MLQLPSPFRRIDRQALIRLVALGCVALACIAVIVLLRDDSAKEQRSDLVSDPGWLRFMGATTTPDGLRIVPLNRIITHQDGSAGQPNPPVNLFGPHLAIEGDFTLTATMGDIDGWGSLRLYGEAPIIYDQWRHEGESIDITVATTTIIVRVWDGTSSNSNDMRAYPVALTDPTTITLKRRKDEIVVGANGLTLGAIPDHGVFDSGEMWFGADADEGSEGWILQALTVAPHRLGTVENRETPSFIETHDDGQALRNLARLHHDLAIGAAVSMGPLLIDTDFRKLAVGEFSMWTPENSLKPQFIHPEPETYAFRDVDTLVAIARANEVAIHGHVLVYHKSTPDWMLEAPKETRQQIMVEHIQTVVGHFKGRVAEWDVVNEPLSGQRVPYQDGGNGLEQTIWYEAMGEEYIDIAFRAAHEADPMAKLYVNDYGLERDGERWDAFIGLVKRLKARGVPIHGVGFESHIYGDGDYIDQETLKRHMHQLATLGLSVRISEMDVTGDDEKTQVEQYVLALDVCIRSPNCTAFSMWGITDKYGSTTRSDRYPLVFGTSLLWDSELKPKSAYTALQERLRL